MKKFRAAMTLAISCFEISLGCVKQLRRRRRRHDVGDQHIPPGRVSLTRSRRCLSRRASARRGTSSCGKPASTLACNSCVRTPGYRHVEWGAWNLGHVSSDRSHHSIGVHRACRHVIEQFEHTVADVRGHDATGLFVRASARVSTAVTVPSSTSTRLISRSRSRPRPMSSDSATSCRWPAPRMHHRRMFG